MQDGFAYFGMNTLLDSTLAEWEMTGEFLDALPMSLWTLNRWYHIAGTWVSEHTCVKFCFLAELVSLCGLLHTMRVCPVLMVVVSQNDNNVCSHMPHCQASCALSICS